MNGRGGKGGDAGGKGEVGHSRIDGGGYIPVVLLEEFAGGRFVGLGDAGELADSRLLWPAVRCRHRGALA